MGNFLYDLFDLLSIIIYWLQHCGNIRIEVHYCIPNIELVKYISKRYLLKLIVVYITIKAIRLATYEWVFCIINGCIGEEILMDMDLEMTG